MRPGKLLLTLATALCLAFMTACSVLSPETSWAATHPEALGQGRPSCSGCHGDETLKGSYRTYASFDHTDAFVRDHRFQANQAVGACATCHSQSFCSDCHGGKVPMAPATKWGNRPDRDMPHRPNYLALHRIDGKMDPSGCYRCHGRANNEKCSACHK
jgi:hypothetical protein